MPTTPDASRYLAPVPGDVPPGTMPLVRPEPLVRVDGIAYVAFERPDLALAERFLTDFGLIATERRHDALHLRAAGSAPFCYVVRKGPTARYLGAGFTAATGGDLDVLAAQPGASRIERVDDPGGGARVVLTDPKGFRVEVVHGAAAVEPLPARREPTSRNTPLAKPRVNAGQRPALHPAEVWRLGHLVLTTPDFETLASWYMRNLGLLPTDVQCLPDGTPALAFLRCDRGTQPADHHTVVIAGSIEAGFGHAAFEVLDLDEIGMGHNVLRAGGWTHVWGIGRHILGSQLFDYWSDPWGAEHEHYADGDVFDASWPTGYHGFGRAGLWMWGQDVPAGFGVKLGPRELASLAWRLATGEVRVERLRQLKAVMDRPARPWLA